MKQTLPREKQPSAINQAAWNQHGTNGEQMGGRGGREFSFRRPCKLARERRVKRDQKLDEVFHHPSLPDISNFPWNEMKKWRANSHNKADNRAIKITFARPKKAKRSDKKKEGKKKRKNSETRISCPILPPPPLLRSLGSARWKISSLRKPPPPRRARTCNTPPPFFSAKRTHTPPNHAFSKHESYAYIRTKSKRKREREREKKKSGLVLVGSRLAERQPSNQPASQPAGRPTNHSTFHSTVLSFPPRYVMKSVPAF